YDARRGQLPDGPHYHAATRCQEHDDDRQGNPQPSQRAPFLRLLRTGRRGDGITGIAILLLGKRLRILQRREIWTLRRLRWPAIARLLPVVAPSHRRRVRVAGRWQRAAHIPQATTLLA